MQLVFAWKVTDPQVDRSVSYRTIIIQILGSSWHWQVVFFLKKNYYSSMNLTSEMTLRRWFQYVEGTYTGSLLGPMEKRVEVRPKRESEKRT